MRAFILYIVFFIFCSSSQAQKEYNRWYFGNYAGLNFNTCPPTPLTDSRMWTSESSSSICDSSGNLLFYTNGDTIWNRNHQLMLNWESSEPFAARLSAVTGSMILPVPGSKTLYYIFLGVPQEELFLSGNKDTLMHYYVIDIKGDGGLGEVIEKDKKLIAGYHENFGIGRHANGADYWIAASHWDFKYSRINLIRTTNGSFSSAPIHYIVDSSKEATVIYGNVKFSPNSGILCGGPCVKNVKNKRINFLTLYRFDNKNGKISSRIDLPGFPNGFVPVEFSATSRYLYAIDQSKDTALVCQYDLSVWDSAVIVASRKIIHSYNAAFFDYAYITDLQLGPDGKIYCFYYIVGGPKGIKSNSLSVIHYPDLNGKACTFDMFGVKLAGRTNNYVGPSYPSIMYKFTKGDKRKINICKGDVISLSTSFKCAQNIIWNTGEKNKTIKVSSAGVYTAISWGNGGLIYDTFDIQTGPKFKVYIGNDTAFCHQFSHIIKASPGFKTYNWNTGSMATQITVNSKGIYSVKVLDSNTCPSGDTIAIDQIQKPVIQLSYDSVNCQYVYLSTDSLKGLTYLWSNGETNKDIKVSKKGWISLTASHQFCSNKDSVYVNQLPTPEVDLGIDTSLCANELVLKTKEQGRYLWSTMETRPSIVINQPGKYWLTVTRNNCSATDTINVKLCEDMLYYIPDVFSPNGDNINEVFRIYGSNIVHIEMEIFNRWGELLLKTSGKDVVWDGTYKNELCMESVYFYKATIKGRKPESIKNLKGSVTLIK